MRQLGDVTLFKSITEEERERILNCAKAKIRTLSAGSYIFEQEERPSRLFLLLKGQVHICKDLASGRRDVLYLVEEGNVFGEMFLFGNREKYWYGAVAVSEVEFLEMPWDFFYHFCSNAC